MGTTKTPGSGGMLFSIKQRPSDVNQWKGFAWNFSLNN